jgi:hypothetical protein
MSFTLFADQNPECWGAIDFVDQHMQPIVKVCRIESMGMGKPPGGGGERVFFVFKGDRRKCYLKKTARVVIANKLRTQVPDEIVGADLKMTAVMARNPKASPRNPEIPAMVFSMTVLDAAYPKGHKLERKAPEPPPVDDGRAAIEGES